jgi:hypothetical protein
LNVWQRRKGKKMVIEEEGSEEEDKVEKNKVRKREIKELKKLLDEKINELEKLKVCKIYNYTLFVNHQIFYE